MKFLKDQDINFKYYHQAYVVADMLSCIPYLTLSCLLVLPKDLREDFRKLEINVVTHRNKPMLYTIKIQLTLM